MIGKWLFRYRDFEFFHGSKYLTSREERGKSVPAFYPIPRWALSVRFVREYDLAEPDDFSVRSERISCVSIDGERQNGASVYTLPAGRHKLMVTVANNKGMCALRIDGENVFTDEQWCADAYDGNYEAVGFSPLMEGQDCLPGEFEFPSEEISPVSDVTSGDERIVDFGRETFVSVRLEGLEGQTAVYYGESLGETYSDRCVIVDHANKFEESDEFNHEDQFDKSARKTNLLRARACRFIRFTGDTKFTLKAFWIRPEYQDISLFESSDEKLKKIWDVSKYTLWLCAPMFFLDGIKRDRWPWAGDACITARMNYYSFFDADIVRRTLIILRGEPQNSVVNGILEYSFYWFIALYDYYFYTGDLDFIRRNYSYAKQLIDGYIRKTENRLLPNFGAWLFIDWHDIEKSGYNCCVQMLYGASLKYMAEFAGLLGYGDDAEYYKGLYDELYIKVNDIYWDSAKHAYVSTYCNGKPSEQVRRHQNYLAVILGYADRERTEDIIKNVLKNDSVPKLTTPFYKFFEYEILCRYGMVHEAFDMMKSYYGSMIDLGATTIWEEFDPDMSGEEHYAMYGEPYDKSLCHAWGAGTLYFVGAYLAGVKPTAPGYAQFEVSPEIEMGDFNAIVPVNGGAVSVTLKGNLLEVYTDRDGGSLIHSGKSYKLEAGQKLELNIQ